MLITYLTRNYFLSQFSCFYLSLLLFNSDARSRNTRPKRGARACAQTKSVKKYSTVVDILDITLLSYSYIVHVCVEFYLQRVIHKSKDEF